MDYSISLTGQVQLKFQEHLVYFVFLFLFITKIPVFKANCSLVPQLMCSVASDLGLQTVCQAVHDFNA